METCETCGNRYGRPMLIHIAGKQHIFDCFECAIQAVAPRCENCNVPIIGHGLEVASALYCSAHCSRMKGEKGLCDHLEGHVDSTRWSA